MRYGQRPSDIDSWSERDYGEALSFMKAEAGYSIEYDEIKEQRKELMQVGTLLDLPRDYWLKFVVDGNLDKEALLNAGYDGAGQPDWLEAEMKKLGWVAGGEVVPFEQDAGRVPFTQPPSERKRAVIVGDVFMLVETPVEEITAPPAEVIETE